MCLFFFFNDTATTEIYTLSLHDALPISAPSATRTWARPRPSRGDSMSRRRSTTSRKCSSTLVLQRSPSARRITSTRSTSRSEEHTSELQSRLHLVCRLLLEKKKNQTSSL